MRLSSSVEDHEKLAAESLQEAFLHLYRAMAGRHRQDCEERYEHQVRALLAAKAHRTHVDAFRAMGGDPSVFRKDWRTFQKYAAENSQKFRELCLLKKPRKR